MGISQELWHRFEPNLILRHAYCCNSRKSCAKATNIIYLLVKCLLYAIF